jgi:hypothetical protein
MAMAVAAGQQNIPLSDFCEMRPMLRHLEYPLPGLGRDFRGSGKALAAIQVFFGPAHCAPTFPES